LSCWGVALDLGEAIEILVKADDGGKLLAFHLATQSASNESTFPLAHNSSARMQTRLLDSLSLGKLRMVVTSAATVDRGRL
jgi:hypothetical protein